MACDIYHNILGTYHNMLGMYQQDTRHMRQTMYLIRKQPREVWDPTLWEIPLHPFLNATRLTGTRVNGRFRSAETCIQLDTLPHWALALSRCAFVIKESGCLV